MAEIPGLEGVDTSEIFAGMWANLPPEMASMIDTMFSLGKIILLLGIAYVLILILMKILGFVFGNRKLKKIHEDIEITNQKLDEIVGLLGKGKVKSSNVESKMGKEIKKK